MSRFLAIDADAGSVHVAAGSPQRGTLRVERAATVRLTAPLTPANAADLGREFKDALRAAGIAPAPVLAVLGRDRVILKDVKIPRVSPHEEPAVVRFQAGKDATEAAESTILDYYALDREEPDGQVRVVSVSVRKDVVAAYKAFCQAAGLKLSAMTPRPLGTLAALDRAVQSGAVTAPEGRRPSVAVLTRGERWGELVIARDGQVVFARAVSATALTSEPMLLGELRRNLAVYNGQNPAQPVEAVYVAEAAGPGGWAGRIRAGLTVPVQEFDPLAGLDHRTGPDDRGHFAPLIGLLQLKARGPLPIDFITVRQPALPANKGRQWVTGLAGLATLLVVGGFGLGFMKLQAKNKELVRLGQEKKGLEDDLGGLEMDRKRMLAFKEWDDGRVNWLDEFYDVTAQFPDPKTTRLEQFRGDPQKPEKGATTKVVGQMKMKINTESPQAFTGLQRGMQSDKKYHAVVPTQKGGVGGVGSTTRLGGGREQKEVLAYELKADLERRNPNDYFRTVNAEVPAKPSRGRGDDADESDGSGFGAGAFGAGGFGPGGFGAGGFGPGGRNPGAGGMNRGRGPATGGEDEGGTEEPARPMIPAVRPERPVGKGGDDGGGRPQRKKGGKGGNSE